MALASFNFIALTHKTVVNSGTCGKFIFVPDYISYLCEILLYICPEITFCNLRCDNQANFPPRQQRLDKCHFNDDEHLGFVIGYQAGTFSANKDEHLVLLDQLKLCHHYRAILCNIQAMKGAVYQDIYKCGTSKV